LQFHLDATIIYRDLANLVPLIDDTWINAKFTPPDQYTPELAKAIAFERVD